MKKPQYCTRPISRIDALLLANSSVRCYSLITTVHSGWSPIGIMGLQFFPRQQTGFDATFQKKPTQNFESERNCQLISQNCEDTFLRFDQEGIIGFDCFDLIPGLNRGCWNCGVCSFCATCSCVREGHTRETELLSSAEPETTKQRAHRHSLISARAVG